MIGPKKALQVRVGCRTNIFLQKRFVNEIKCLGDEFFLSVCSKKSLQKRFFLLDALTTSVVEDCER